MFAVRFFYFFFLLIVCVKPTDSFSGSGMHQEKLDSLIHSGIRFSALQNYEDALRVFISLQKSLPESPVGYFFHAAVLQTRMMDYENNDDEKVFLKITSVAMEKARRQIKQKGDAWSYFYLGGSYGYIAFYKSKQNKYLDAFKHAQSSLKALQTALKIDSTLFDAYLGIGSYLYYRGQYSKYLAWLPMIEDERGKAIGYLRLAIKKSKYSRYSAMNGISWILMKEKRYDEGLEIINAGLRELPESRVFLWAAAKLNQKKKNWQDSARFYKKILTSFNKENVDSPVNRAYCHKNLCEIYFELGNRTEAELERQNILKIPVNFKTSKSELKTVYAAYKTCSEYLGEPQTKNRR